MGNKIYISGAITGTKDYMKRFEDAEEMLKNDGFNVVNPAKICEGMPDNTTYEEYMKIAFTLLGMCDGIYMLDGWEKSCGANREYGYAIAKGYKILRECF